VGEFLKVRLSLLTGLGALVLAGCDVSPPDEIATREEALSSWAEVLGQFVDSEGRVDFAGLADTPVALNRFVNHVYRVGPNSHPEQFDGTLAALAYYINAYNALAMYNVLDAGIPRSLANWWRHFTFFYARRLQLGGTPISLYHLENDIIRPLGDERVHFALNCMAVACPRLPKTPFAADRLNNQLEQEARRFFGEPCNLVVDDKGQTVRVSAILKFYTEDFLAKAPTLIAYINRYRETAIPDDYEIVFIAYDWTVNRRH
jgi:hypothetical protein